MTKHSNIPTRIDPSLAGQHPWYASIEPINRPVFLYPYHLGTDERLARELIKEIWTRFYDQPGDHRVSQGLYTIALMRSGIVSDVWDGRDWANELTDLMHVTEAHSHG